MPSARTGPSFPMETGVVRRSKSASGFSRPRASIARSRSRAKSPAHDAFANSPRPAELSLRDSVRRRLFRRNGRAFLERIKGAAVTGVEGAQGLLLAFDFDHR